MYSRNRGINGPGRARTFNIQPSSSEISELPAIIHQAVINSIHGANRNSNWILQVYRGSYMQILG
ncbi:hypothetical protein EPI10_022961 [Gossypium australe]|uniref:Uncharacterized protein n=1 Tax=Gossypium australe TaxID=47621 RepID=A0A5B6VTP9_9ROSI|nr:hypothetical protein EPI10_022961 [Gossypium australe]